nr:RNA-directed DNA polymerase (reverse transcriptase) domain containing protein [Haemonchus contortus]
MVFIHYQKAFDTIEYKIIWKALEKFGVDDCLVRIIKQLYAAGRSFLALGTMEWEVDIQRGVRQGDSLSPLLFILTLQSCLDEIDWCDQGYPIEHVRLNYLAYADDMFLCSPTVDGLQAMLDKLIDVTKTAEPKMNSSKRRWMSNNPNGQQLKANGEEIELVSPFIYLGQLVCFPQYRGQEVNRRISAAWSISRKVRALLRSQMTPTTTKRHFFHKCVLPTPVYGCETWALTKAAEDRIRRCQRRTERQMLGLRLLSNAVLRGTKLKDAVVEARKRKWIYENKLMTRDQTRWEVRLMKWKPHGMRPVGRPRIRWKDDFKMFEGTEWKNIAATSEWFEIMARFSVYGR